MIRSIAVAGALCILAAGARAQSDGAEPPADPLKEKAAAAWSFSAAISLYAVPDDHEYVQPTLTADYDWLHLEGRYNYEALESGSLWAGFNFGGGEEFTWAVTPMLGAVFGQTGGVAPGYEATLGWKGLELYSEGEYLFDSGDSSDSFFYNWSEFTYSPIEWFRFGIAAQRTRLYDSDRDIQRGPLVGFTLRNVDLSAYLLDPDGDDGVFVLTVEVSF